MIARDRYSPVVLTAAISGGDALKSQSPAIPCGVEAIVAEGVAAARAGAACVHIHGRKALTGEPTGDPVMMAEIAAGIRAQCDVVISFTTGGSPSMSEAERFGSLAAGKPEIATFNLGTMNYEGFPTPSRFPRADHAWEREVLAASGNVTVQNTLAMMRRLAALCKDLNITPELEAYDLGHLSMARFLLDEGTLQAPVRIQFVLGVLGGAGHALEDLFTMKQAADRLIGRDAASYGVAAVGYPMELRHCAVALGWGLDCRVGLEDNLRTRRDRMASSNAELVQMVVQMGELLGRPLATPAELRASLGPWWAGRSVGDSGP